MTFPVLKSQWQFDVNRRVICRGGPDAYQYEWKTREGLYAIKDSFLNFAYNPWTVVGSSNASTWGMDGVDRWTNSTAINNGSWIVLRQSALLSGNVQLCIQPYAWGHAVAAISPRTGFTGSSATVKPWALDEFSIGSGVALTGSTNGIMRYSGDTLLHSMQTRDGKHARFFVCGAGITSTYFMLSEVAMGGMKNLVAMWQPIDNFNYTYTFGGQALHVNTEQGTANAYFVSEVAEYDGSTGGTLMCEYNAGQANEITNEYQLCRLGLVIQRDNPGIIQRGYLGVIDDLYMGSLSMPGGTTFPVSASGATGDADRLVQWNNAPMVTPWSGSLMMTA